MTDKKPFEIARETLKQLTARKLAPTPVNYKSIYNEIGGIPSVEAFPSQELRSIAQALPHKTPGQQRNKALIESAIDRMNWDAVRAALVAYGGFVPAAASETTATAVLPKGGQESDVVSSGLMTTDFLGQIARLIEYVQPALGGDDVRFTEQTTQLLKALKQPSADVAALKLMLVNYSHRLSFVAEDQAEIRAGLLKLLQLVLDNIQALSPEDQWLQGQMQALKAVTEPPFSLRRLDDLETKLKDVVLNQKMSRQKELDAQDEMRQMLAAFVERLSKMAQSTGSFHSKLEESAKLIEEARSLEDVTPVLKEVVRATRVMANDSLGVRDELTVMREQVNASEMEIVKLHQELDRVSAQARHDPLTGALNRKGLEEILEREISGFRRRESPLSVAMLDIDNFKKLNDARGHAVGDTALTHLATVARECMRPQDSLARYGGEEFVVLLPDTPMQQGIEAMTRLQRELTRRFFLAGEDKVLITFSAGVAQLAPDETGMDAIRRADEAMYLAKRSGKNRVVGA